MDKNEKAALDAGTPRAAAEQNPHGQSVTFVPHAVYHRAPARATGNREGLISKLLPVGAEAAISTEELVQATGLFIRKLRAVVAAERSSGALILSSRGKGGGYYLPSPGAQGQQEIIEFIRTNEKQARSMFAVLRAARAALNEIDGQQRIKQIEEAKP